MWLIFRLALRNYFSSGQYWFVGAPSSGRAWPSLESLKFFYLNYLYDNVGGAPSWGYFLASSWSHGWLEKQIWEREYDEWLALVGSLVISRPPGSLGTLLAIMKTVETLGLFLLWFKGTADSFFSYFYLCPLQHFWSVVRSRSEEIEMKSGNKKSFLGESGRFKQRLIHVDLSPSWLQGISLTFWTFYRVKKRTRVVLSGAYSSDYLR